MIAVDTNVVVRLLVNDDLAQARKAAALFRANDVFIPRTVLLETEWVLRYSYELTSDAIVRSLRLLAAVPTVTIEAAREVDLALGWFEQGLDFADALHLACSRGARQFATFDRKLVASGKRIARMPVIAP